MHDQRSKSYFERRAEQERTAAEQATSERSARPHREMADRYRKLATDYDVRPEPPDRTGGILSERLQADPLAGPISPPSASRRARDHLVGALIGERLSEQIALDRVAAEVAHALEVLGGLHALGGDRHPETLG